MNNLAKLLRVLAACALLLTVGGCATSGQKFSEMNLSQTGPAAGQGRILIYRTAVLGAAIQPDVRVSGQVVGSATPQGFMSVERPAGTYEIVTSTEVTRKLSLTLEPGQTRYVRLNISMGFFVGHVYPELVDNAVGEKEIRGCRLLTK